MEQTENPRFDWQWRDDVFNQDAIDLPLVLPPITKGDGDIQIKSQFKIRETVFGKNFQALNPVIVTMVYFS